MSHARASKGCQQCRSRKCDENKPSCNRCVQRGELCTGPRDTSKPTFQFKDQNEKAASLVSKKEKRVRRARSSHALAADGRASDSSSSPTSTTTATTNSATPPSSVASYDDFFIPAPITNLNLDLGLDLQNPYPWLKTPVLPEKKKPSAEERAVSSFFEKFVMYPCKESSSPGFLELLPCLFEEVQREGRLALRWAVKAVSYASLAASLPATIEEVEVGKVRLKANECYGRALAALGETLRDKEERVSDYTLMTVVVLDLFETIYLHDSTPNLGSHTEGMAQILRLRGPDQLYSARGWSLFRLANHRLQRQQLAFPPERAPKRSDIQDQLVDSLADDLAETKIEKDNYDIGKVCSRARELRVKLSNPLDLSSTNDPISGTISIIREMHALDATATSWRSGPKWTYQTLPLSSLILINSSISDLSDINFDYWPKTIELHHDAWIAYEWNYHRTGRIILHTNLIECLDRLLESSITNPNSDLDLKATETYATLHALRQTSLEKISVLVDSILATVPQSLGDIDNRGYLLGVIAPENDILKGEVEMINGVKAVGAYFLLWSVKVIKGHEHASREQRELARATFERIREISGMKRALGEKSCI
ncbi:hypothetical protein B0J14DRAFT_657948 [Halenospora varia]|nr:hypothetical protein B0J14DRAFT_657948 [Halenospora varia]